MGGAESSHVLYDPLECSKRAGNSSNRSAIKFYIETKKNNFLLRQKNIFFRDRKKKTEKIIFDKFSKINFFFENAKIAKNIEVKFQKSSIFPKFSEFCYFGPPTNPCSGIENRGFS